METISMSVRSFKEAVTKSHEPPSRLNAHRDHALMKRSVKQLPGVDPTLGTPSRAGSLQTSMLVLQRASPKARIQ